MPSKVHPDNDILQIEDVHKSFGGNRVLRGVSFTLPRASVTALIGSNGAGKSTFLNILSGLVRLDSGAIRLNGIDLTAMPGYLRSRAGIGRTFQHPRSFRTLTVFDAVLLAQTPPPVEALGRNMFGVFFRASRRSAASLEQVMSCLDACRLSHKSQTLAADLTYGEQKLLMMAQTLSVGGELFCLDELCAGLEPSLVDHIGSLVVKLAEEGKTVLFVEHNLELVRKIAGNAIFLHEGAVFRQGRTSDVLSDPSVVQLYLGD